MPTLVNNLKNNYKFSSGEKTLIKLKKSVEIVFIMIIKSERKFFSFFFEII